MGERLTTLRPRPRLLSPLTLADVEAGLAACRLPDGSACSLGRLSVDGAGAVRLVPPQAEPDALAFLERLLCPSSGPAVVGFARRHGCAVEVAGWVAHALAGAIAEAKARADAHLARSAAALPEPLDGLFEGFMEDRRERASKAPAGAALAREGMEAWSFGMGRPLADVLRWEADATLGLFFAELDEDERRHREQLDKIVGAV